METREFSDYSRNNLLISSFNLWYIIYIHLQAKYLRVFIGLLFTLRKSLLPLHCPKSYSPASLCAGFLAASFIASGQGGAGAAARIASIMYQLPLEKSSP